MAKNAFYEASAVTADACLPAPAYRKPVLAPCCALVGAGLRNADSALRTPHSRLRTADSALQSRLLFSGGRGSDDIENQPTQPWPR